MYYDARLYEMGKIVNAVLAVHISSEKVKDLIEGTETGWMVTLRTPTGNVKKWDLKAGMHRVKVFAPNGEELTPLNLPERFRMSIDPKKDWDRGK